jgi:hypothetical protein
VKGRGVFAFLGFASSAFESGPAALDLLKAVAPARAIPANASHTNHFIVFTGLSLGLLLEL